MCSIETGRMWLAEMSRGSCLEHFLGRLAKRRREGQGSSKLSSKPTLSGDQVTAELMFEGSLAACLGKSTDKHSRTGSRQWEGVSTVKSIARGEQKG